MTHDVGSPPWGATVVWYFYLTGIASGACLIAGWANFLGNESDQRAARPARYAPFPLAVVAGLLTAVGPGPWGSTVPFEIGPKGTWALAAFGAIAAVSFLVALVEDGQGKALPLSRRKWVATARRGWAGKLLDAAGACAAVVVGSGVGALPTAKGHAGWGGGPWLGPLFLASAASTGAAALVALGRWRDDEEGDAQVERLEAIDALAILVELAALVAFAFSLRGTAGLALTRWPGMLVPLFVVPVGLVLPLLLRQARGPGGAVDSALLVLFGGFVLRFAVLATPGGLVAAAR